LELLAKIVESMSGLLMMSERVKKRGAALARKLLGRL
jgi:hypothetical protein